jgi:hypothetical protein
MPLESENIIMPMIANVPGKIEKAVLNKPGVVASFEVHNLKIFVKTSSKETNRLEIDHVEAGDIVLRYPAKDAKEAKPIEQAPVEE